MVKEVSTVIFLVASNNNARDLHEDKKEMPILPTVVGLTHGSRHNSLSVGGCVVGIYRRSMKGVLATRTDRDHKKP